MDDKERLKLLLSGYSTLVKRPPSKTRKNWMDRLAWEMLVKHMEENINYLTRKIYPRPVYKGDSIKKFKEAYPFRETVEKIIEIKHNKALCIFHLDKHPSMHVYEDHAYCFSCGESADIVKFLMRYYNCNLKDLLIQKSGITEEGHFKVIESH